MKAVFLDRATFSAEITLAAPEKISDWQVFDRTSAEEVYERAQDAEIIITNKVVLHADLLARLSRLKLIQITATGMNNVDIPAAQARGIAVKNVAAYSVESVAEHVMMFMLAALRGLKPYHQAVQDGSWQADGRFCLTEPSILDLHNKTLGIIGAGDVGKAITQRAAAFGMQVLWAERRDKAPRNSDYLPFEEVLAKADVISLNCPLTDETKSLIKRDTIALMKKKPLLINAARGPVVESQAVVDAVEAGELLGYCGDVFIQEPPAADEALLRISEHPRVLFTPHIAWASEYAQRKLWTILTEQVNDFISQTEE